jgi:hypothetical protein
MNEDFRFFPEEIGVSVHFLSVTNYRCHLLLIKLRYGAEYF